jgi:DNA-binding XRE family transcriptional regulator
MLALPKCKCLLTAQRPLNPAYPKELKTIGDEIRKRRLDLGLTQKQVAGIIGVTESSIYNWERAMNPAVRCAAAILRFVRSEVDDGHGRPFAS